MSKEGIAVSVNISDDTPLVKAKTQEIQQVFLNIISNSRYALNQKFSNPDKRKIIEINSETIHIKGRPYVRIIVYDRGEGIRKDLMDKICNPFFTTKPPGKGTGLGLSICHGIIEDHNGIMKFESVYRKYTKVMIDLPIFESEDSKFI
jgi:signal transduction histidine kinase